MARKFTPSLPRLVLAPVLMLLGVACILALSRVQLVMAGRNLTSIGLLVGGWSPIPVSS